MLTFFLHEIKKLHNNQHAVLYLKFTYHFSQPHNNNNKNVLKTRETTAALALRPSNKCIGAGSVTQ